MGGADKVSTFVSLLGAKQLNVAVLIDADLRDQQRLRALQRHALLSTGSVIQMSEFVSATAADIEDLFEPAFYCELLSGAYVREIPGGLQVGDLTFRLPRIVERVQQYFRENRIANDRFNHYRPAAFFLRDQPTLLPKLGAATLDRF